MEVKEFLDKTFLTNGEFLGILFSVVVPLLLIPPMKWIMKLATIISEKRAAKNS